MGNAKLLIITYFTFLFFILFYLSFVGALILLG